jgi:putative peptidoglycan lipid II flippase
LSRLETPIVKNHDARQSVLVSALTFATGTMLSRILGLFRDMLIARYFSDDVRDAFLNAFRLPNLFRRILGEGSLSVSFIPVFVDVLTNRPGKSRSEAEEQARGLVASIFSILLAIVIPVTLLAIIFMDDILHVLLNGAVYMSVPEKFELTVRLARIMFGFLVMISLYGFFMAVLNSLKKFAMTALAPCFFNVVVIFGAMIALRTHAPSISLAWTVLAGGFAQMLVLLPSLKKAGYLPKFSFDWDRPDVQRVLKAVLPSIFGLSILQLTALVNMRFAADLASGTHSYLYLADRILELPLSLFVVSIGAALLPTLSSHWAAGDREGMGETINHYVRLIFFAALPAAIGMFILAQPISEVLFVGREFKYDDALATASVIRVYSFLVIFSAGVRILAQGFYAIQNTWFPALAAAVALISHVLFAYVLTREFKLEGLAAASVASSVVHFLMLATAYNAWVGSLHIKTLLKSFAKFVVCGGFMVATLQAYVPIQRFVIGRFYGSRALGLVIVIALGGFVYLICAHLLRINEYRETVATLKARLFKGSPSANF